MMSPDKYSDAKKKVADDAESDRRERDEIKQIIGELKKASAMHAKQAERLQRILDNS
jgi:hypothetical protein|tara:strand:+ start:5498 stop:5668 length:171 start_codon:yes stop_codon:yes gene_type:complete